MKRPGSLRTPKKPMSVNHLSKEIVITIVFVCGDEEQAHHVASYIHAKVGQRLQPNSPRRVVHNSIRNRSRTLNRAAAASK